MSVEEGAQVLTGETVAKAFDLLMNPDYPQRAEAAKRDLAMYNWLTKGAGSEE